MVAKQHVTVTVVAALTVAATLGASVSLVGVAAADPGVTVDAPDSVAPGGQATINVTGDPAGQVVISGETGNWTVNATAFSGSDPLGAQTTPNSSQLPYDTPANRNWSRFYLDVGTNYFELTVTAPEEPGTYNFTATVQNGSRTTSRDFSVEVASQSTQRTVSVEHADSVSTGAETTINVSAEQTGTLLVQGETRNWTVTGTAFSGSDPLGAQTTPNSSQLPYDTPADRNWSRFYLNAGHNYFELTVTAPDEPGTYNFTAVSRLEGSAEATGEFAIEVTNTTSPTDGVSGETYDAASGGDGELSRQDVVRSLRDYIRTGGRSIGGVTAGRTEVVALIRFYIQQALSGN